MTLTWLNFPASIHRNPLRAGMVRRLMDYKWSSYPAYAYGMKAPAWLKTRIILSQFGKKDPQLAYTRKVQRYSGEEASLFEELRYGLFFGTASFADKLKSWYLRGAPHPEIPQQSRLVKDHEPEKLINELSVVLGCNPEVFRKSLRISEADKSHRDVMVYFLWQTGRFSNRKIAELFGLSYSSVSKRAGIVRKRLRDEKTFKDTFDQLNALIQMWTLFR
jgi:putative transposase